MIFKYSLSSGPQLPTLRLLALCSLLLNCVYAVLDNDTSPTHQFKSRPDIHAPIIDMTILRPELVLPGYLFLAPYRSIAAGPHIYDNYGNLVWAGAGQAGPMTAHLPHVCQYRNEDHLCFYQGDQRHGYARGYGVIMDKSYQVVKIIYSAGAAAAADMHEFRMTPYSDSKTVLMTVYQPVAYDLTVNARFNRRNGMSWVNDATFQEVDVQSGRVIFEWRSLDHVDPSLSQVMPGTLETSGTGLNTFHAWDYFHINSIDKNKHGDYLISARHTSAIYKISGGDGHIIWQIGGSNATLTSDFQFNYQHDARWISENVTHTILSFFDNGIDKHTDIGRYSRGLIVCIDHKSDTATIVREFNAADPGGGLRSISQGNMQLLPHGGYHIGWGDNAVFSEHLEDGDTVMYGRMAAHESNVMIYRSHKFNWTAQPLTKPALWTYSKSGDGTSGTRFYVSWNGATEIQSWYFYTALSSSGPFSFANGTLKTGFETEYHVPYFSRWSYAEALDADGNVLERSGIQRTFTPSPGLIDFCDERGCQYSEGLADDEMTPFDADVTTDEQYVSTNRGFDGHYYVDWTGEGSSSPTSQTWRGFGSLGVFAQAGVFIVAGAVVTAGVVLVLWYSRMMRLKPLRYLIEKLINALARFVDVTRSWFGRQASIKYKEIPEKDEVELSTSSAESSTRS